jgi:hypothetical protein
MTQKHSLLKSKLIWKLTLVASACFLSSGIYASHNSLRDQIHAREYQIQDSPDADDFFVGWFDELAENTPDNEPISPSSVKPKPLHGEDDTFFPVDETEGRMPSSRLQNLLQSAVDGSDILPSEVRDDLSDWEEKHQTPDAKATEHTPVSTTPKKVEPLRRRLSQQEQSLNPISPFAEQLIPEKQKEEAPQPETAPAPQPAKFFSPT